MSFSYASNDPHRIEFFDDEVDSLRTFAVDSQLSIQAVKSMQLVANVEEQANHPKRKPVGSRRKQLLAVGR